MMHFSKNLFFLAFQMILSVFDFFTYVTFFWGLKMLDLMQTMFFS